LLRCFGSDVDDIEHLLHITIGGCCRYAQDRASAALQGLAWLVTSGTIGDRPLDAVVAGTIEILTDGLRSRS
jgi:hypothetical protein